MRRPLKLVLLAVGLVVVAGAGLFAYAAFRNSDAPDEVALSEPGPSTSAPAAASTPEVPGEGAVEAGADGRWVVQEDALTFVGYRVTESFVGIPNPVEAVGRTPAVSGELTVVGQVVETTTIAADLTQLTSDESRRDSTIRDRGLESTRFPEATFTLTSPLDLGAELEEEVDLVATGTGDLTLHGVTRPVEVDLEARWSGDTVEIVGSLPVEFSDYEIEAPSIGGFVSVEDDGIVELSLLLTRA